MGLVSIGTPGVRVITLTVDPPLIGAGAAANVDVATGAAVEIGTGDRYVALAPATLEAGLVPIPVGIPPAANQVRVRLFNPTAAGIDGAALVWTFLVFEGA